MRKKWVAAWLLALAACAPTADNRAVEQIGASDAPLTATTTLAKTRPDAPQFTTLVLRETNKARRAAGLKLLVPDHSLTTIAQMQARNMARDRRMNHMTSAPGEQTPRQRMAKVGLNGHFAENIARNFVYDMKGKPVITRREPFCHLEFVSGGYPQGHDYETMARAVVAQWMRSPHHRKNILNPVYRRMGAGLAPQLASDFCGDVYLAQTFAD